MPAVVKGAGAIVALAAGLAAFVVVAGVASVVLPALWPFFLAGWCARLAWSALTDRSAR